MDKEIVGTRRPLVNRILVYLRHVLYVASEVGNSSLVAQDRVWPALIKVLRSEVVALIVQQRKTIGVYCQGPFKPIDIHKENVTIPRSVMSRTVEL